MRGALSFCMKRNHGPAKPKGCDCDRLLTCAVCCANALPWHFTPSTVEMPTTKTPKRSDPITATFFGVTKGAIGSSQRFVVRIFGDDRNVTGNWRNDYGTPEMLALCEVYDHIMPTGINNLGTGEANPIFTKGHW